MPLVVKTRCVSFVEKYLDLSDWVLCNRLVHSILPDLLNLQPLPNYFKHDRGKKQHIKIKEIFHQKNDNEDLEIIYIHWNDICFENVAHHLNHLPAIFQ